jgi:T5SS/PEP-CTERM-associated repeat protein
MNKLSLLTTAATVALFAYSAGTIARADIITTGDTGTPNVDAFLVIGDTADGTLTVNTDPGGSVVGASAGVVVGNSNGATGEVLIDGAGAQLNIGGVGATSDQLVVGGSFGGGPKGIGVVTVSNGGEINIDTATASGFPGPALDLGLNPTAHGTLSILSGGKVNLTDTADLAPRMNVSIGRGSAAAVTVDGAGSELNLVGGSSTLLSLHVGLSPDGNPATTDGSLTVSDGGKVLLESNYEFGPGIGVGVLADATGLLKIDGGEIEIRTGVGSIGAKSLSVGSSDGSDGQVEIVNGGVLKTGGEETPFSATVGFAVGSNGSILVDGAGSKFEVRTETGASSSILQVGRQGTGSLTVSNGGVADLDLGLNSSALLLASSSTGSGTATVTGAGSLLKVTGEDTAIIVGSSGVGTLDVLGGFHREVQRFQANLI